MGFFDRILRIGKAYDGKRTTDVACDLTIEGERYMLEMFDIEIDRETDKRYIPVSLTLSGRIAPKLENWIMNGIERKDGIVRFYNDKYTESYRKLDEGALFDVCFYDALCVGMHKESCGETVKTTLRLAVKRIRAAGDEYEHK